MIDPVSLSVAAGLVWIGDKLIKDYKDKYSPTSNHTVPKPQPYTLKPIHIA